MSLVAPSKKPVLYPAPKYWTGEDYDRLVEMGAFTNQRLELIRGVIYDMSPMNDPHAYAVVLVQYALLDCFDKKSYTVKVQSPMRLGEDSRPEPDVCVLAGPFREQRFHPTNALLIVEVADASLEQDEIEKCELYSLNSIADYWIVNLRQNVVTTYREPNGGKYARIVTYGRGQEVSPLAMPSCVIAVNDLLP